MSGEKKSWKAMLKFANDEPLTDRDWEALSWLTLIDRKRLAFEPGNVRWAKTAAERADNPPQRGAGGRYVTNHAKDGE